MGKFTELKAKLAEKSLQAKDVSLGAVASVAGSVESLCVSGMSDDAAVRYLEMKETSVVLKNAMLKSKKLPKKQPVQAEPVVEQKVETPAEPKKGKKGKK